MIFCEQSTSIGFRGKQWKYKEDTLSATHKEKSETTKREYNKNDNGSDNI